MPDYQPDEYFTRMGVYQSITSFEGSQGRWGVLMKDGATDEQLSEAIAREFGISGGCSLDRHYWVDHYGGSKPFVRVMQSGEPGEPWRDVAFLQGSKLISMVRSIMGIDLPGQLRLF